MITEVEVDTVLEGSMKVVLVKLEGVKVVIDVRPDVSDEVNRLEVELKDG